MPLSYRIRELSSQLVDCDDDAESIRLARELQAVLQERIGQFRGRVERLPLPARGGAAFANSYKIAIESVGGKFVGLQTGPKGSLVLFADPESLSTLAIPEESFSAEHIARRLAESRSEFGSCG